MRTHLCDTLGIDVPVMQAAIGGITCPALAAAVSNAGGLGTLAMTGRGKDGTTRVIAETRALTSRAFAANFLLPYDIEAELQSSLEAGVPLISLFWGDPAPYVSRVHDHGALLIHTVGSVEDAKHAANSGVDVIIAQGWEAGGHVCGTVGGMALLPDVVDAVGDVPVVAAGGISDGRGLAAALSLGAQGVWVGTRFLSSHEAAVHPDYQARVLQATSKDTYYSKLYDGTWPDAEGRTLRNTTVDAWEAAGHPVTGQRPNEGELIARTASGHPIHRYDAYAARHDYTGNIEAMPLWAGQGVGQVQNRQPAAQIVSQIASQAQTILAHLSTHRDVTI